MYAVARHCRWSQERTLAAVQGGRLCARGDHPAALVPATETDLYGLDPCGGRGWEAGIGCLTDDPPWPQKQARAWPGERGLEYAVSPPALEHDNAEVGE